MKKSIITSLSILGIFGLGSVCFADNSLPGDCVLVTETYDEKNHFVLVENLRTNNRSTIQNRETIIPSEDLNIAFLNLRKNCCEHSEFGNKYKEQCGKDTPHFKNNTPKSYLLFNHLLDVIMRRLDGDMLGMYEDGSLDPRGVERRAFIEEKATQKEGTLPQVIQSQYNKFWSKGENKVYGIVENTNLNRRSYVDLIEGEQLEVMHNYENRSLRERYNNACNLAGYLYFLFNPMDGSNGTATNPTIKEIIQSGKCKTLIEERIKAETSYTHNIITKKSDQLKNDNLTIYTNVYLRDRLGELTTKLNRVNILWGRVEKATPELTPICN
ncbi:MAG: hypothetical protein PHU61_02245 [Candidatus Absconditabacteria bacterium]|nr:hypothetical protein [Candidatus Absconditabacteria bacterium]MDD3868503.1 hypothetical protein [Candidatus Absconditabacteria bacterium]MDD4713901.1 hypothetical protein [Candidatus Absconditabacteria bacterium]